MRRTVQRSGQYGESGTLKRDSLATYRRLGVFSLLGVMLCVTVAMGWPVAKSHLQAFAVLRLVSGQKVPWIVARAVIDPVRTHEVQIETAEGPIRARVYEPVGNKRDAALVVFHGVHYLGMDEPRLMGFAAAMASCGLQVLTPELPGIKDYHVSQSSVRVIGETTQWFAQRTGAPVGVMGLSFSGGLALVAASESQFQPDFKFVFAVGSQDSMEHVAQFYLTGQEERPNGTTERLRPHEYGALVLEYEHLEDFVPRGDFTAIQAVLREHLYENKTAENAAEAELKPSQRAEASALMDTTASATLARLAAVDRRYDNEMAELSPAGRLRSLTVPVYLLHGEGDNIIPAAETLWMVHELPEPTLKAALVSPVLSHLDLDGAAPTAGDEWHLLHFFALVMQAAGRR